MSSLPADVALPRTVYPLVDEALYMIGDCVDASTERSFLPRQSSGWISYQGYVVCDGREYLLIDTGLTSHKRSIREGLMALCRGARGFRVLLTRREMDCMMNLDWILAEFTPNVIHYAGELNPLDFFESMDAVNAEGLIRATSDVALDWQKEGSEVRVGRYVLQAVRPAVRVLSTNWYYEPQTRTLFTSDFWGFITMPRPAGCAEVEPTESQISVERIRQHLISKFDWLRGIDPTSIIDDLHSLFTERRVERVCPSYGAALRGYDAILQLKANTISALKSVGAEPRRSVVAEFSMPARASGRGAVL